MIRQQIKPGVNDFLSEIIIGMSDGLIVPFALTAGLSRASDSPSMILTAGMVALTAGSVAMGFGGYLTGKTETDLYRTEPDKNMSQIAKEENAKSFFANLGLSEEMQSRAAEELVKDKKQLEELLGQEEAGIKAKSDGPARSGITIGLSYALGGLITVSPYFYLANTGDALKVSVVCTLFCLFVLGYLKSRITAINPIWGAFKTGLVGALAAAGAYVVAGLFVQ